MKQFEIGDLVKVYSRKRHRVGSLVAKVHKDPVDNRAQRTFKMPEVKPGWWVVSVESDTAKGGYAYFPYSESSLTPHDCTEKCGKHLCQ